MKKYFKYFFTRSGLTKLLAEIQFSRQFLFFFYTNNRFRKQHPTLPIPPNRELFETFRLNYRLFFDDGKKAATEMAGYFQQHQLMAAPAILDWGCGLARVVQFFPEALPGGNYFGCDINSTRIHWNKSHHPTIAFSAITGNTLPYANQQFDGIYGLSVLTHIDAASQLHWLKELHRILKPGGILILSTQGESYYHQLNPAQLKNLIRSAAFSNPYQEDGHRMMSTYHHAPHFKKELENIFSVLEYYNGKSHPALLGGQDLWIVRRT